MNIVDHNNLLIRALGPKYCKMAYSKSKEGNRQVIDFDETPDTLKGEYMKVYECVELEIVYETNSADISDLGTTYLGKENTKSLHSIKTEEQSPIKEHGYTTGKLLDGTECQILWTHGQISFLHITHIN